LTLSASAGTLTLSPIAGLETSGDGTASLTCTGPLRALDSALDGLTYTPPAGPHVFATLTVDAESAGAAALQAQRVITDGVFSVETTADAGPGSLRQAISNADTVTRGTVAIDFDIPGAGVRTINLASPLPAITTSLVVDGTTQPGYAGTPLIAFDGATTVSPLTIADGDVTIRGLAANGVAIDPVTRVDMIGIVEDPVGMAPLSLIDSGGHPVVQSRGVSPGVADEAIHEQLAAGSYSLSVADPGRPGPAAWTLMLRPASAAFQPIQVGVGADAMVAGDFAGNGKLDLAVTNGNDGTVSVLLGNGDGTFQPAVNYPVGTDPDAIVAGDFAANGKLDLAVANELSDTVSVLMGNGDGTFQPQVTYAVGSIPDGIVSGAFTGGAKLDLAITNAGDGTVSVLLGNGDGTF
jgi:hypothetical protein